MGPSTRAGRMPASSRAGRMGIDFADIVGGVKLSQVYDSGNAAADQTATLAAARGGTIIFDGTAYAGTALRVTGQAGQTALDVRGKTVLNSQNAESGDLSWNSQNNILIHGDATGNGFLAMGGANGAIPVAAALVSVQHSDGSTSTVLDALEVHRTNSAGNAVAGQGAGIAFVIRNGSAAAEQAGRSLMRWTTVTPGAESAVWAVGLKRGGAALPAVGAEHLRLADGWIDLRSSAGQVAGFGVSTLNASFTDLNVNTSAFGMRFVAAGSSFLGINATNSGGVIAQIDTSAFVSGITLRTNAGEVCRATATNGNFLVGTITDVASSKLRVDASKTIASAAGAIWNGIDFMVPAVATITGATNITTATGFNYLNVGQPTLSAASALTVSDAATVYIAAGPVGTGAGPATITRSYPLWIDSGTMRYDDNIALGGGAGATLGTIGGAGPAAAAQNEWLRINVGGNVRFIPLWA